MDAAISFNHHKSGIATQVYSPEFLCRVPSIAKETITQLEKTGDNFSVWEQELKVMIRNLSGSMDYLLDESNKYDPKLNQAVFNLIFWSVDKELRKDLNIYGSAGEAFQVLASRFQSDPLAQCIISRAEFPEEILDNIVNMVYHQSSKEHKSINGRKSERLSQRMQKGPTPGVYLTHYEAPLLTTFQNLAVVNRKFHRLCVPKLWQHIRFPSALPAPMSLWTEDILLRHGHLVQSLEFKWDSCRVSDTERGNYDNIVPKDTSDSRGLPTDVERRHRQGIGLMNVKKIFKTCPLLESVSIDVAFASSEHAEWGPCPTMGLAAAFCLVPQLQHLRLIDYSMEGTPGEFVINLLQNLPSLVSLRLHGFHFRPKLAIEESLGWSLSRHQKLRRLSLSGLDCEDGTWTLKSWARQLETLELDSCSGLSPSVLHGILSGSAPFLTGLKFLLEPSPDEPRVTVRFDLPALKKLYIFHRGDPGIHLLLSFEDCKSIEDLEYRCPEEDDEWNTMEHYLSRHTWPELSVLKLHTPIFETIDMEPHEVDIIINGFWDSYQVKLLIN